MPRKSKDELKNVKTNTKNTVVDDVTAKLDNDVSKTSKSKKETKKSTAKVEKETKKAVKKEKVEKEKPEKTNKKKTSSRLKKSDAEKAETASKKTSKANSLATKVKSLTKRTTTKKNATKKASTKKATKSASKETTKTASSSKKQVLATAEYYDLPYRYNQTVVKILAQTPTMLFIYWDLSDADRQSYIQKYGESFFNDTKPVLIITNKTMNYTFEVEINDFANSWYLPLKDPDCDYSVELGRKPKNPTYHNNNDFITETVTDDEGNTITKQYHPLDNYIYICTSNDMEMPNNHILFDRLGKSVFFKNVKNNFIEEKNISSLSFITNIGKVYNIYDLYKEMYKDEINAEDLTSDSLNLNLSSSGSSTFK